MPLAVTHVLVPIVLVDMVRDHLFGAQRKKLPNKFVLLAGIAGLLPDVDFPLSMIFFGNLSMHRAFTHTFLLPLAFLLAFIVSYFKIKKRVYWKVWLMLCIGTSIHIALDVTLSGSAPLLFPLTSKMYGLNLLPTKSVPLVYSSVDALLLLGWLLHEEFEHKNPDFL